MESLGLPDLSIVLVWIVGATVFLVQKAKAFVCRHFKGAWTQKVPWWVWLVLSIAIPFALVFLVVQPWAQNLINSMLPDALDLDLSPDAAVPTALTAVLGANGAYAVSKRLGLTGDYSPGGPLDVTPPTVPGPGDVSTVPAEENSQAEVQPSLPSPDPAPMPMPVALSAEIGLANSETVAYLLNFCDTDPAIGPHVVLLDGKLYRVEHGKVEYLPKGWTPLP